MSSKSWSTNNLVASFPITLLTVFIMAAYPALVYFGLRQGVSARWLALGFLAIIGIRWGQIILKKIPAIAFLGIIVGAMGLAWIWGEISILYYPVAINLILLFVFGSSLWLPPTVIERLARLRHPVLDEHGIRYTRRVTQVWCGFFGLNGSIALATALYGNQALWALYNGFLGYVFMGLLFGCEWLIRRHVMASKPG